MWRRLASMSSPSHSSRVARTSAGSRLGRCGLTKKEGVRDLCVGVSWTTGAAGHQLVEVGRGQNLEQGAASPGR
jgi:hypothetical protein